MPQGSRADGRAMAASIRNVVLMLRDLPAAVQFYQRGLGLRLARSSEVMAEFDTGGVPLVLKAVEGEAMRSTGYSPFLCFNVADMDSTIVRLLQMGAALDGPIKYPAYGKVAAVRSPDGHMIGLFEPGDGAPVGPGAAGGGAGAGAMRTP